MINNLDNIFKDESLFISGTLSSKTNKDNKYKKVVIEQFDDSYKISKYTDDKVFHDIIKTNRISKMYDLFSEFRQLDFKLTNANIKLLVSKKGKVSVINKNASNNKENNSHNKVKNHLIKEGEYVHWLYKLSIMDKNGNVHPTKQKKFKQINKFLENIDSVKENINDEVNIVDIGCGKSYLTFAVYHYLTKQGKKVNILGIDLKEDVIKYCQELSDECGFDNLKFVCEDVFNYELPFDNVDMVISLHACDIATDFALYNAIKFNSKIILSVPCCQHELKQTIKNDKNNFILKHGIFKDRFSSILTDSIRAQLLSAYGYDVAVAEFIDMQYTAKNVLIKAIKKRDFIDENKIKEVCICLDEYNIEQKLYNLLKNN